MGGAIAQDVALRFPARVAGMGLVATGARLRVAPAILEGIRKDPEAAVALIGDWAYGPEAPEELVRLGRRQMAQVPADVLYHDFLACDGFNLMEQIAGIEVSAFVLCGTRDRLTPSKYSVYLRDQIPNSTLHLVEGAGHMVMVERPVAVFKALTALLEAL
jgi:pimeloyl-ACP methyl ester carboxylesterase